LSPLLRLGNWAELDPDNPAVAEDQRFYGVRNAWAQTADAKVYDEAFHVIRKCLLYSEQFKTMTEGSLEPWGYNREWAGPLLFLHFAPEEYFLRVHQRQPYALVVFAYFGALVHGLDDHWYAEGWGKDIVEVVDEFLGEYWRRWISWPREAVGST
jgi:hypothetical protein